MNQKRLAAVLAEFARTLVTDYPVEAILDHLVHRVVEVLPVTGAGVMLAADRELRVVAASDDVLLRIGSVQERCGEGPCVDAYRTGQPVLVPDLAQDRRFPCFAPEALAAGVAAVFTFPMRWRDGHLGALDLYCDAPCELTGAEFGAAQVLADVAAAYVVNARARDELNAVAVELERRSLHDPLTGLANRALLLDRLTRALLLAERSGTSAGVLFIDLDGFKDVNDTHGHHVGDALLLAVADRLQQVLRPGDTLSRLGGDEFVVVCEGLAGALELAGVADRVTGAFGAPFPAGDLRLTVDCSVGTALGNAPVDSPHDLLQAADRSMYRSKGATGSSTRSGGGRAGARARRPEPLDRELAPALADGSLQVVYQPVLDLGTASWVGVEALVRWPRGRGGTAAGARDVIAAAERSGLIVPLGAWVLARACSDVRSLDPVPGAPRGVAVNVTVTQLSHPAFADIVADILQRTSTRPGDLSLEVVETEQVAGMPPDALRTVVRLRQSGVRIAVDGFANRRSTFGSAHQVPVDVVKIGRAYVGDLGREPVGEAVVESILGQAAQIDVRVVAEGIETTAQLQRLRALGCPQGQGFLLGRPRSLGELRVELVSAAGPATG